MPKPPKPPLPAPELAAPLPASTALPDQPGPDIFQARLQTASTHFAAPAGQTLLLSALAAGHDLPSSCRNGTCRACICKLDSGRISYRIEWPGLSREEKAEGLILPCVAYPASDVVLSLAPAAGG